MSRFESDVLRRQYIFRNESVDMNIVEEVRPGLKVEHQYWTRTKFPILPIVTPGTDHHVINTSVENPSVSNLTTQYTRGNVVVVRLFIDTQIQISGPPL